VQDPGDYLSKETIKAIKKAAGKQGNKVISWAFKGRAAKQTKNCNVKAVHFEEGSEGSKEVGDEVLCDAATLQSASASMGQGSANWHQQNPNSKHRKINAIRTVLHSVKKTNTIQHTSDSTKLCRVEVDSRADTCCAGATFYLVEETDRTADVEGFHEDLWKLKNIPIGTCYTAIDHPGLQETIIGVFHECLYFGDRMEDSLINPNQLCANGLIVDTCPKQFSGSKSLHGIYNVEEDFFLPFRMHGCINYFSSRMPTMEEIASCCHVAFTSEQPWDPYSQSFMQQEQAYQATAEVSNHGKYFSAKGDGMCTVTVGATSSHNHHSTVNAATLAQQWGTSLSTADKMLACTTTRAVQFYPANEFIRRFWTRQAQLCFPHLWTQ